MAKYQCVLEGDFDELLRWVDGGIIGGSASASYEDGADYDPVSYTHLRSSQLGESAQT